MVKSITRIELIKVIVQIEFNFIVLIVLKKKFLLRTEGLKMKVNAKQVSLRKLQKDAENQYKGGFFCCEALIEAVRDNFELDVPDEVIAMTSGMAVGVGRSGCICGALNGGIMSLGMFFGRTVARGPQDPQVVKVMSFTKELHDWFKDYNTKNATCCRVLTREFDMEQGEHKAQCIYFTGLCAWKVGEIVCRELGIENIDNEKEPDTYWADARKAAKEVVNA